MALFAAAVDENCKRVLVSGVSVQGSGLRDESNFWMLSFGI
jgi:hypothetical protein